MQFVKLVINNQMFIVDNNDSLGETFTDIHDTTYVLGDGLFLSEFGIARPVLGVYNDNPKFNVIQLFKEVNSGGSEFK